MPFAVIAGSRFGNYKDGFRFGRLGYELVEKRGLTRYQARTYISFGNIVMPWAKHALEGRDLVRRAFDGAYRIGDLCANARPFSASGCTSARRIRTEYYWRFTDAAVRVAIKRTTFQVQKKLRVVRLT